MDPKRTFRNPLLWVMLLALGFIAVFSLGSGGPSRIDTSAAMQQITSGNVKSATLLNNEQVQLVLKTPFTSADKTVQNATNVYAYYVDARGRDVVTALDAAKPSGGVTDQIDQPGWLSTILLNFLPLILMLGLFWFILGNAQGGGNRVMQFGKSRAKLANKDMPQVTFADVAGADEAVEELQEIKEFLQDPGKFLAVGAKIPKGVLLYGPPGTGKTLLARAVAGEAKVPFYSISGSDFVEMFVGVGASRVRDLFEQAKAAPPAIIFVDEIDAVGRHRGAGLGGGHDEREQTLNQLLVEMDGFDVKTNVILIAATNRPDILDPALLRPGRFDRQIAVEAPDMIGRHRILQVHSKGKPMAADVDLLAVARRTPGFTGADLANVLNEAALLTARSSHQVIDNAALDEAIDRVIAGPQKRTRIMSAKERKITAYHEGGHALVAAAMNHTDPVTKVTILPRGRALGYTMVMPMDDKYSTTRNEILDQLAYALGGRVAEEIVFHEATTGASNDIEKATAMARKMVTEYGMSERIGAVKLGQSNSEVFLGRDMGHQRDYSEELAGVVDEEVRRLIDDAHDEAYAAINTNRDVLDRLVLELLEKETLNQAELAGIFGAVSRVPKRETWLSSEQRVGSDRPPVQTPAELAAARGDSPALPPPSGGLDLSKAPAPTGQPSEPFAPPAPLPAPAEGDPATVAAIDKVAEEGASPYAPEHSEPEIVELPEGEVPGDRQ